MTDSPAIAPEIEIKLRVPDLIGIRATLTRLQATPLGSSRELKIFFDRPDKSLRLSGAGLRLRWI